MNNKKITNSCKNQHIIPQFLQKNFSKTNQLIRHNKDKSFIVNIANNFSENEYYSERPYNNSTELTLDQKITKKENSNYSPHLNYLMSLDENKEFFVSEETSNFIYHFIYRNKKIMKSIIEALEYRLSKTFSTDKSHKDKIFNLVK